MDIKFERYFHLLTEGGKTFKGATIRIPRESVPEMIDNVIKLLMKKSKAIPQGFTRQEITEIGSIEPNTFRKTVNSKQDFGDLDLAVDVSRFPQDLAPDEILETLKAHVLEVIPSVTEQYTHINKGLFVVSFVFPIPGMSGKNGQVDLMPSRNHKYNTEFAYTVKSSKTGEVLSRNKEAGAKLSLVVKYAFGSKIFVNNQLLTPRPVLDVQKIESLKEKTIDKLITERRFYFQIRSGICLGERVLKWKRDGSGLTIKQPYKHLGPPLVNPEVITAILFGKDRNGEVFDPSITYSVETIHKALSEPTTRHATFEWLEMNWNDLNSMKANELPFSRFVPYTEEQKQIIYTTNE